ncbi:hypothetical protein MDA_GLEAN10021647 [Myotis davidii]|uniref:Uncharacterized protein n=1 Tax=Myotis davidii TaxID=225400 RepID=L5M7M3_MYODS|nr:hypothetical protein MDA_GLEAN10021647 [Myotis davidii]
MAVRLDTLVPKARRGRNPGPGAPAPSPCVYPQASRALLARGPVLCRPRPDISCRFIPHPSVYLGGSVPPNCRGEWGQFLLRSGEGGCASLYFPKRQRGSCGRAIED